MDHLDGFLRDGIEGGDRFGVGLKGALGDDGQNQYLTRAGNFSIDANGNLIAANGLKVMGRGMRYFGVPRRCRAKALRRYMAASARSSRWGRVSGGIHSARADL